MSDDRIAAIIVAAGSGERMGLETSKPFLKLGKKAIVVHAIERFEATSDVDEIVVVVKPTDVASARDAVSEFQFKKVVGITTGGPRRQDSVHEGLRTLANRDIQVVLVHDGVRPFATPEQIHQLLVACRDHDAAILAVPPKDTIKQSNTVRFVQGTLDRAKLWVAQTPQAFRIDILTRAYEKALQETFTATDDSSLVERLGVKVKIIEGSYENIKITTPEDLELAELILQRQAPLNKG